MASRGTRVQPQDFSFDCFAAFEPLAANPVIAELIVVEPFLRVSASYGRPNKDRVWAGDLNFLPASFKLSSKANLNRTTSPSHEIYARLRGVAGQERPKELAAMAGRRLVARPAHLLRSPSTRLMAASASRRAIRYFIAMA